MSKDKLIEKLASEIQSTDDFPKPTISKILIGPNERARSQYPTRGF